MPSETLTANGLLTYEQAAEFLGVCLRTLETLVKRRKVRCLRPSPRVVRFRQCDLEAYLSQTASVRY